MSDIPALVAWLRGCLDEDEAIARAARGPVWPPIVIETNPDQTAHIARWDPAAVLADVDAKRRVLNILGLAQCMHVGGGPATAAATGLAVATAESAVKHLARSYRGRPGWREEWK